MDLSCIGELPDGVDQLCLPVGWPKAASWSPTGGMVSPSYEMMPWSGYSGRGGVLKAKNLVWIFGI